MALFRGCKPARLADGIGAKVALEPQLSRDIKKTVAGAQSAIRGSVSKHSRPKTQWAQGTIHDPSQNIPGQWRGIENPQNVLAIHMTKNTRWPGTEAALERDDIVNCYVMLPCYVMLSQWSRSER